MTNPSTQIATVNQSAQLTTANSNNVFNLAQHYILSLTSANSQKTMANALQRVLMVTGQDMDTFSFNWESVLSIDALTAIRSAFAHAISPDVQEMAISTANNSLRAIRGVLKSAWLKEYVSTDTYHKLLQSIKDFKQDNDSNNLSGRDIALAERQKLYAMFDGMAHIYKVRNIAIYAVLQHGLRASEMCRLSVKDLSGNELTVIGKGNKKRIVILNSVAVDAVQTLIKASGANKNPDAPLFPTIASPSAYKLDDNGQLAHMTRIALYRLVKRHFEKLDFADTSPHDFRRTVTGDLLDAGVDIVTVANTLGHAHVTTTQRYDRRGKQAQQSAVELIHIPVKS